MKRIWDKSQSQRRVNPCVAARARRSNPSKGWVSVRESGRRLLATATRGRLQSETVESGTMEGGTLRRPNRSAVIRARELAARAVTGEGSWLSVIPKRGDVKHPPSASHHEADARGLREARTGCPNRNQRFNPCLLYTSPSPRDRQKSRMPSSA